MRLCPPLNEQATEAGQGARNRAMPGLCRPNAALRARNRAMPGLYRPIAALLLAFATTGLVGCADSSKKSKKTETPGTSVPALAKAASTYNVPEKHLLTAAFVQSQVGNNTAEIKEFSLNTRRDPVFGIALNSLPTDSKENLEDRALAAAKLTADIAAKRQPKNDFDWLLCLSQAIVGDEEKDPNVRDHQIRLTLMQFIEAHNKGYSVFFADGTKAVVEPAQGASKVDLSSLDAGRSRYVTSFGLNSTSEAEFSLVGDESLQGADRPVGQKFSLQIRMCPANGLICFDALRNSREMGVHYVGYKVGSAQWELVQLHPLAKDLKWFGQEQAQTVVVALAGVAGTGSAIKRTDWMDWSDYVALRKSLNDVLAKTLRVSEINLKDKTVPGTTYFTKEFLTETLKPVLAAEGVAPSPAKRSAFLLPPTFDSSLFQEVMATPQEPRTFSQIRVERPLSGGNIAGSSERISFFPDPEATEVLVFQDKVTTTPGDPWDLILKKDVNPGDNRVEFEQQFLKKGINNSAERSLKFVSRKGNGQILSSKIVRFQVQGLKK